MESQKRVESRKGLESQMGVGSQREVESEIKSPSAPRNDLYTFLTFTRSLNSSLAVSCRSRH